MPSEPHEALVARIVATGMRTPEELPDAAAFAAARQAESDAPPPAVPGALVDRVTLGGVPAIAVEPEGGAGPRTVLYFHGGGYLWMSSTTHVGVLAGIARAADARCVGIDYRRAPEHPFPAAVDDAVASYEALLAAGADPRSVVVSGDSAGGGLALAVVVALRDRGLPLPAAVACASPWTDLTVTGASADDVDDPIVSGAGLRMMAAAYLAGADPREPTASPLHADLSGLPPVLILVGTREALLDDARRVAARARAAGVDVELVELEDVVHMWLVFDPTLPESVDSYARIGAFVRRHAMPVPAT